MKETKERNKRNQGITLIALIITIIVMLILVAVTITVAVNGGLFGYAERAATKTNEAIRKEQDLASGDIIDYYLNRKQAVVALDEYKEDLLNDDGVLTKNTKYESGYNIAVIPKGFKLTDEKSIEDGLVIEDAEGNQFVWIPVKDGTFERTGWWDNEPTDKTLDEITEDWDGDDYKKYIALSYGYDSIDEMIEKYNGGYDNYEELLDAVWGGTTLVNTIQWFYDCYGGAGALSDNYTESATNEYESMVASVNKYGGFYIGRYEAGSQTKRTATSGVTTMVVQQGAYPYNYVKWGDSNTVIGETGAVYLSRNMYTDSDTYEVISTLCYGVQWDAILRFIREDVDVTNSTAWGNYKNNTFNFTEEYTETPNDADSWDDDETGKLAGSSWLLTTGASEKNQAKNIYDLAGNVWEWTMESAYSTMRVTRGGVYNANGCSSPASDRGGYSPTYGNYNVGFRPALYIK